MGWVGREESSISKIDAINYLNHLKEQNLSDATIQQRMLSLSSYFRFLIESDVLDRKNPFSGIRIPRINRPLEQGLSDDEVRGILREAGHNLLQVAVIKVMLYNGLRRNEVVSMNVEHIKVIDGNNMLEIHGKGDKVRTIPLHDDAKKAILAYLGSEGRNHRFDYSEPVFKVEGKRIKAYQIYHFIRKCASRAGIERSIHPHLLRAKFASRALEQGQPITSVMNDMGHANVTMTASYDKNRSSYERSTIPKTKPIGETGRTRHREDSGDDHGQLFGNGGKSGPG
jgi:site-specific recombinase XerD